jgi:hypothetical protein
MIRARSSYDAAMKTSSIVVVMALVSVAGCKKEYPCQQRGDTDRIAQWKALGFATDGANVKICEASKDRFDAVVKSPPNWAGANQVLDERLRRDGWVDLPSRSYAPRVDRYGSLWSFARCATPAGSARTSCNAQLNVSFLNLPAEQWKGAPYFVHAQLYREKQDFVNGKRL